MRNIRFFAISSLFFAFSLTTYAQLEVNSSGLVRIGDYSSHNSYKINLLAGSSSSTVNSIGILGKSYYTGNNPVASCGVYGIASNNYSGMCYGVAGALTNNSNGVGVIGSTTEIIGFLPYGKYAGYFLGNTNVNGTLTATTITQTSDIRLKENITSLSSREESALGKLLNMNAVEYNYKPLIPSLKLPDSVSVEDVLKSACIDTKQKHFGLIAQELQEIYPELVVEGQDGYLSINYVELVPVLIQSIQELNKKIDALQGISESRVMSSSFVSDIKSPTSSKSILYQNSPNPFKETTTIRFSLEDNVNTAFVCIFDMTGKMLKKVMVSNGDSSISINRGEIGEGMFFYSLIVNGREIDTKRMIITK